MINEFKINNSKIGLDCPVYFIADIAANHDGSLERAITLIDLAKNSGADAVKFQHHDVSKYVSDYGFKNLGQKQSHQQQWTKSVFEVYKDAEVPKSWTSALAEHCNKINIDFMSTPYDLNMVDHLDKFVPAYKIGSGDLAWDEMLIKVASKNKPIFIATGASTFEEVKHAHDLISSKTKNFCLMQCNTNYTGSLENFSYINLNVLSLYKKNFPNTILGLSDHTPGHETVLGSIALGARAIEKHFTDDTSRSGPDHPFSMDPDTWSKMIVSSRILEKAMGDGAKRVEKNEEQTVILQRRAIRVIKDVSANEILKKDMVEFQRPCPKNAIAPNSIKDILGKRAIKELKKGEHIKVTDIE